MILTSRHLPEDDLALFALQLLEGPELEKALDHLEHCEECRHEVARFQGDLVGYALSMSDPVLPPVAARERLMKSVAKEKKVVPVERVQRPAPMMPPAPAERPLQQMAERLASGRMQPIVPEGDPRESRTRIPVAQQPSAVAQPIPMPPLPVSPSRLEDEEREPMLASRGRRMFESIAPVTPDEDEEADVRPRAPRGLLITLAGTGWAIAACMMLVAGLQYGKMKEAGNEAAAMNAKLEHANETIEASQMKLDTLLSPDAMQVVLKEPAPLGSVPPPPKPEGHVAYMADKGSLVFIADHLNPLPSNKTYELWLLQPEDANGKAPMPVPAGLFKPDARGIATVVMPDLPKGMAAHGFGVTMENDGGSKTPTAPIVMVGY